MVCKKNIGDFILVWAEECPTSSEGGEFCIILHRSARSRDYKQMREREGLLSLKMLVECTRVCVALLESSQGLGESCDCVLL
jgi:hypothetical protein